ncbi:MAG: hypothetical protein A2431_01280 [Candidatus Zambryskibacteria bacterium RIFOXYC1_FULL_39_10]|uniref:Uncharacterized protein n=1 Tax=Candidatus Zambryskibacteria bacterium RIFOXYC1_FULL_39_10 TaxID=1802779 RepID=A0A1G2UZC3_9BACT|nr:MAG: hypothetical protein A2431_01280 [Candidatus Zambryskibacteria bacterium RIFOXYC1_FULL_39_10]
MKFIPVKKLPMTKEQGCWFIFKRSNVKKHPYVLGHWNPMINLWVIAGNLVEHKELHAEGYTHFVKIEEE